MTWRATQEIHSLVHYSFKKYELICIYNLSLSLSLSDRFQQCQPANQCLWWWCGSRLSRLWGNFSLIWLVESWNTLTVINFIGYCWEFSSCVDWSTWFISSSLQASLEWWSEQCSCLHDRPWWRWVPQVSRLWGDIKPRAGRCLWTNVAEKEVRVQ